MKVKLPKVINNLLEEMNPGMAQFQKTRAFNKSWEQKKKNKEIFQLQENMED